MITINLMKLTNETVFNLLSQRHADLLGDVVSKGVDDVSKEVHVQHSFAIPIIDVADLLNSCSIINYCFYLKLCMDLFLLIICRYSISMFGLT